MKFRLSEALDEVNFPLVKLVTVTVACNVYDVVAAREYGGIVKRRGNDEEEATLLTDCKFEYKLHE